MGKIPGDTHQLVTIKCQVNRFLMIRVNARPDDMAVLASFLDMEHDGAWLVTQPQHLLGAMNVIHVLVAGERTLCRVWVNREAVEILLAAGQCLCLYLPFFESTMQVMGNRTT